MLEAGQCSHGNFRNYVETKLQSGLRNRLLFVSLTVVPWMNPMCQLTAHHFLSTFCTESAYGSPVSHWQLSTTVLLNSVNVSSNSLAQTKAEDSKLRANGHMDSRLLHTRACTWPLRKLFRGHYNRGACTRVLCNKVAVVHATSWQMLGSHL